MATVYKGNKIGTTKSSGLFEKLSDEGTDLKKLKFRDFLNDVSRAPYVEHDINTGEPVERDSWWKLYQNTSELAVQRRIEDVKRLTKFIASPKGVLWESERAALETIQKNLQQAQVRRIEKIRGEGGDKPGFWKSLLGTAVNLGKSVLQGIGLTAATLEQAGVSGTGAHVVTYAPRAYMLNGKNSTILGQILSYTGLYSDNNLNGAQTIIGGAQVIESAEPDPNRLMVSVDDERLSEGHGFSRTLYGLVPTVNGKATFNFLAAANASKVENYRGEEILAPSSSIAFNLKGAPVVTGSSIVQREVDSAIRQSDKQSLGSRYGEYRETQSINFVATDVARVSGSSDMQYVKNLQTPWLDEGGGRVDFVKQVKTVKAKSNLPENLDEYAHYVRDGKMQVAGTRSVDVKPGPVETITVRRGTSGDNPDNADVFVPFYYNQKQNLYLTYSLNTLEYEKGKVAEDLGLIPFCITTITPDRRTYLNFPAYLESYDDSYSGEWESVKYVGRPENFYGYKGFTRSINLSFKVVAFRRDLVEPLYRELNRLVGATAPTYSPTYLFMRGTLSSLTIGDLLRDQLGIIPSVKLSWSVDDPWEIDKPGYPEIIRVPHVLTVNLQFTPIEKQEVRDDYGAYFVFDPEGSRNRPVNSEPPTKVREVENELPPVNNPTLTKPVQIHEFDRDHTATRLGRGYSPGGGGGQMGIPVPNPYDRANSEGSYGRLGQNISNLNELQQRLLFGSDYNGTFGKLNDLP